jgi:hypothetical protein
VEWLAVKHQAQRKDWWVWMSLWQGQGIQVDDEWVMGINFIEQN